jgi:glycosyltransferase involved in cell wall biosynthesis
MASAGESLMRVSVVIPALNEAESIGFTVSQMPWHLIDECIVVDNGSTDATAAVARAAGARIVTTDRGYGAACMDGAASALPTSDLIVFMDGDGSDVPSQMSLLLAPIETGEKDFVMGTRLGAIQRDAGSMLPSQVFAGWLVSTLLSIRFPRGFRYSDMGPFRAIRRSSLQSFGMRERTYGWSLEMQIRAIQHNLRIAEVPVNYRVRHAGDSKVAGNLQASIRAGFRILEVLVRVSRTTSSRTATSTKTSA